MFKDRIEAGLKLANELNDFKDDEIKNHYNISGACYENFEESQDSEVIDLFRQNYVKRLV